MSKRIELSEQVATEIAGSLHRLNELGDSTIVNPATEAEVKGLRQYLANTLPQYANELIANWFIMRNEYEPLIGGFTALMRRANWALNVEAAARQEAAKGNTVPLAQNEPGPTTDNIIPLKQ